MKGWIYNRDLNDLDEFNVWDFVDKCERLRQERLDLRLQLEEKRQQAQDRLEQTPKLQPGITRKEIKRLQRSSRRGKLGGGISGSRRQQKRARELEMIREEFTLLYLDTSIRQLDIALHFKRTSEWVLHTAKYFKIYSPQLARTRREWKINEGVSRISQKPTGQAG